MRLALTVSMYSDLFDLRATGAGLVDMVIARHYCFSSQLACLTRYMSILFLPRVVDQNLDRRCRRRMLLFAA